MFYPSKQNISAILLFFVVQLALTQIIHQNNVFLTLSEAYIFFPHRNFQLISTYTSTCSANPPQVVKHHPAMTTIANINFNNSNIDISILGADLVTPTITTTFHYTKINMNGTCTTYEVDKQNLIIVYEHNFAGQFAHVIILDKFHSFLWNCGKFLKMGYSFYDQSVNLIRGNFSSQKGRNCDRYSLKQILCWSDDEINIISMSQFSFQSKLYKWTDEAIKLVLPLDKQEDIFFACSYTICYITRLNTNLTITIIDTYHFVHTILGGDFNSFNNKIVIIHAATALIFTYDPRTTTLLIQESLDFYSEVQCVFIQNVRFLNEQILINCNNFMGQAEHLVLIRDKEINRYFSYQPLENSNPNNPCLFDGNDKYIFGVCKQQIITKLNNFEFFQVTIAAKIGVISIECGEGVGGKIPQVFQLKVIEGQYSHAYVNEAVDLNHIFNYDDSIAIKPRNKFTASSIDYYTIESENCPYFNSLQYLNVQIIYYFSLFNLQKCIQILPSDNRNFYRILQMNQTTYYVEQCTQIQVGYRCRLEQIVEGISSLKLFTYNYRLFKIYLLGEKLIIQENDFTEIIFNDVTFYQLKDNVIRVKSNNIFYSKSILNAINNNGIWIEQFSNSFYTYSQGSIYRISSDGKITQQRSLGQKLLSTTIFFVKRNNLPYILSKGYYLFIINQTHITKLYEKEESIVLYEMPYNSDQYEIQQISSVENYIVIQYRLGFFEIYDTQREAIASLIVIAQQTILCDIIIMDKDAILIPISSQPYILHVQTDPTLVFGPLQPIFSKFHEQCIFQLSLHTNNGSCPNQNAHLGENISIFSEGNNTVSQTFTLTILFNIQKIEFQNEILHITQPYVCTGCRIEIPQQEFLGPVFAYEFNDDDFGTFELISHLNVNNCEQQTQKNLLRMNQIHNSDDNTQNQLLMINNSHVILIDQSLNEYFTVKLPTIQFCVSYIVIEGYYLMLCDSSFILFNKSSYLLQTKHNLSLAYPSYQLKSQFIRDELYYIYMLDDTIMYIFVLSFKECLIQYISNQQLVQRVNDFDIVEDNIITLDNHQICISTNKAWKTTCQNLTDLIPAHYTHDYDYQQFLIYSSTKDTIRVILISRNNDNLHVDMEINFKSHPLTFRIINLYAGYIGFILKSIVSINIKGQSYSNFILHYEDSKGPTESSIIAYYQFNSQFIKNSNVGQIRSALFLENYFMPPYTFSFLSFPHRLYILPLTHPQLSKKYKQCLSIGVEDSLIAVANYKEPPLLKFLILKANNINDLKPFYIKITYQPDDHLLVNSLIGLASSIAFFVVLAVATNRCKEESELTIHFISQELEKQYSEQENTNSDLLHSKSSPRSISPSQSETYSNEDW